MHGAYEHPYHSFVVESVSGVGALACVWYATALPSKVALTTYFKGDEHIEFAFDLREVCVVELPTIIMIPCNLSAVLVGGGRAPLLVKRLERVTSTVACYLP